MKQELFDKLGLVDGRYELKGKKRSPKTLLERQGYRVIKTIKGKFILNVFNPDAEPGKPKAMYLKQFNTNAEAEKVGKEAAKLIKQKYNLK